MSAVSPPQPLGACGVGEGHEPGGRCELTAEGYLRLPNAVATSLFPDDVCLARRVGDDLMLYPVAGVGHGGMVLTQRNAAGDRSLLVHEVLGFNHPHGWFALEWDRTRHRARVRLTIADDDVGSRLDRASRGDGG
jgi:hypothetical protein